MYEMPLLTLSWKKKLPIDSKQARLKEVSGKWEALRVRRDASNWTSSSCQGLEFATSFENIAAQFCDCFKDSSNSPAMLKDKIPNSDNKQNKKDRKRSSPRKFKQLSRAVRGLITWCQINSNRKGSLIWLVEQVRRSLKIAQSLTLYLRKGKNQVWRSPEVLTFSGFILYWVRNSSSRFQPYHWLFSQKNREEMVGEPIVRLLIVHVHR